MTIRRQIITTTILAGLLGIPAAGQTPDHCLHYARTSVRACLNAGVDPNARSEVKDFDGTLYGGDTWLHLAAFSGHDEIIPILLAAGADPNARDILGQTPLHRAIPSWYVGTPHDTEIVAAIVMALLDAGADPNARDKYGRTALDQIGPNSEMIHTPAWWRLHDAKWAEMNVLALFLRYYDRFRHLLRDDAPDLK